MALEEHRARLLMEHASRRGQTDAGATETANARANDVAGGETVDDHGRRKDGYSSYGPTTGQGTGQGTEVLPQVLAATVLAFAVTISGFLKIIP